MEPCTRLGTIVRVKDRQHKRRDYKYWRTANMNGSHGVPKFLTKVWSLVEDPRNSDYICWSQDGNSFIVLDEERFAKEVLPRHFKHNNMASFVRQLNWYGFHKVMQDESGAARHDKYCSGRYQHHLFKRGQIDLLIKIKRKITSTGDKRVIRKTKEDAPTDCLEGSCTLICDGQNIEAQPVKTKVSVPCIEEGKTGPDDMQKILTFLHQLQARQDILDSTVESLKRENEALWKEVLQLRPTQAQFEPVVNSQSYDHMASLHANQPLMIDSTGNYNQLLISRTSQTCDQVFDNGLWSTERKPNRGIKRAMKEDVDSSAEEPNDQLLNDALSQEYDKYQSDDSHDNTDLHSCQSDEMVNEDYASNHNHSFAKIENNSMTHPRKHVPHKKIKTSAERYVSATKAQNGSQWNSSENEEERKACVVDSGYPKKTGRGSCFKIGQMLQKMHQDHTCLTEKVLAVEQQSFQKLSEISTVLSTLANYMMSTQNSQRSSFPHSLDAAKVQANERQNSRHGHWSDATTSYSAKKEYDS